MSPKSEPKQQQVNLSSHLNILLSADETAFQKHYEVQLTLLGLIQNYFKQRAFVERRYAQDCSLLITQSLMAANKLKMFAFENKRSVYVLWNEYLNECELPQANMRQELLQSLHEAAKTQLKNIRAKLSAKRDKTQAVLHNCQLEVRTRCKEIDKLTAEIEQHRKTFKDLQIKEQRGGVIRLDPETMKAKQEQVAEVIGTSTNKRLLAFVALNSTLNNYSTQVQHIAKDSHCYDTLSEVLQSLGAVESRLYDECHSLTAANDARMHECVENSVLHVDWVLEQSDTPAQLAVLTQQTVPDLSTQPPAVQLALFDEYKYYVARHAWYEAKIRNNAQMSYGDPFNSDQIELTISRDILEYLREQGVQLPTPETPTAEYERPEVQQQQQQPSTGNNDQVDREDVQATSTSAPKVQMAGAETGQEHTTTAGQQSRAYRDRVASLQKQHLQTSVDSDMKRELGDLQRSLIECLEKAEDDVEEEEEKEEEDGEESAGEAVDEAQQWKQVFTQQLNRSNTPARQAVAIFDYESQREDELSFSENEILFVIDNEHDEAWPIAKNHRGNIGLVPANYIQTMSDLNFTSNNDLIEHDQHAARQKGDRDTDTPAAAAAAAAAQRHTQSDSPSYEARPSWEIPSTSSEQQQQGWDEQSTSYAAYRKTSTPTMASPNGGAAFPTVPNVEARAMFINPQAPRVQAQFSYEAAEAGELNIRAGQVLQLLDSQPNVVSIGKDTYIMQA